MQISKVWYEFKCNVDPKLDYQSVIVHIHVTLFLDGLAEMHLRGWRFSVSFSIQNQYYNIIFVYLYFNIYTFIYLCVILSLLITVSDRRGILIKVLGDAVTRPSPAGVTMKLEGVALRAVVGGWVVVASLLVWSYSGLLVSVMTVRLVPRPIQTARDLLDHSRARVIMRANTAYTDTLAVSPPTLCANL